MCIGGGGGIRAELGDATPAPYTEGGGGEGDTECNWRTGRKRKPDEGVWEIVAEYEGEADIAIGGGGDRGKDYMRL